jgi:hypothetical protein
MEFNFKKGNSPPPHKKNCTCFRCSHIPWNKGKKGHSAWNKGKKWSNKIKDKISHSLKGNIPWNKGKKLSEEHIKNLCKSHQGPRPWRIGVPVLGMRGDKHHAWKGDKVGFCSLHTWLRRSYGKPNKCDNPNCNYPKKDSDGKMMISPTIYEWSNINGNYNRDRKEWQMLCPSCHRKYDRQFKIRRPHGII